MLGYFETNLPVHLNGLEPEMAGAKCVISCQHAHPGQLFSERAKLLLGLEHLKEIGVGSVCVSP